MKRQTQSICTNIYSSISNKYKSNVRIMILPKDLICCIIQKTGTELEIRMT